MVYCAALLNGRIILVSVVQVLLDSTGDSYEILDSPPIVADSWLEAKRAFVFSAILPIPAKAT